MTGIDFEELPVLSAVNNWIESLKKRQYICMCEIYRTIVRMFAMTGGREREKKLQME